MLFVDGTPTFTFGLDATTASSVGPAPEAFAAVGRAMGGGGAAEEPAEEITGAVIRIREIVLAAVNQNGRHCGSHPSL